MAISEISVPTNSDSTSRDIRISLQELFSVIEQDLKPDEDKVIRLPCPCVDPHHLSCVEHSLRVRPKCPVCKTQINVEHLGNFPTWRWNIEEDTSVSRQGNCPLI